MWIGGVAVDALRSRRRVEDRKARGRKDELWNLTMLLNLYDTVSVRLSLALTSLSLTLVSKASTPSAHACEGESAHRISLKDRIKCYRPFLFFPFPPCLAFPFLFAFLFFPTASSG
jgi:hypothetical protein